MWDKLATNSSPKRVLPSGRNWVLKVQKFDGKNVIFSFESLKEKEKYDVQFRPIYWSVSDEWVEGYGGLVKVDNSKFSLNDIAKNVGSSFPDQVEEYSTLESYFISAMEWNIRFISNDAPTVTQIG